MLKKMKFHEDARAHLAEGIDILCCLLEDTYGPTGQNVLLERPDGSLLVTNSSAAIVQDFAVKNLFHNEGVQLARETIMKMAELSGDGTTLTAILIHSLIREGEKYLCAGMNPASLQKGLKKACEIATLKLKKTARPVFKGKELQKIIETASGSLHIAELVSEAINYAEREGVILVKESRYDSESRLEIVNGMQWNKGFQSAGFCLKGEAEIILKDARVFITNERITEFVVLLPILEQAMEKGIPLLIVAQEVSGEALAMLLHNVKMGKFQAVVIGIDGMGQRKQDNVEDLAIFLGGGLTQSVYDKQIQEVEIEKLGRVKEVRVNSSSTFFLEGKYKQDILNKRCKLIAEKLEDPSILEYDKEKYRERIGRLKERIVILHAGAVTKAERLEEKRKLESAVRIARNAMIHGVTIGGGSALIHCIPDIHAAFLQENLEEQKGMKMLCHALYQPLKVLCKNAGIDGNHSLDLVCASLPGMGYDVRRETLTNMEAAGILDCVQVLCMALELSAGMAGEWMKTAATMVSTAPDREDVELAKQGVPIMR